MRRRIFFAILIGLTILMFIDPQIETNSSFNIVIDKEMSNSASASYNQKQIFEISDIDIFKLVNSRGNVQIVGEDRLDIVVYSTITAFAKTEELVQEYLQGIEVVAKTLGNQLEIGLTLPKDRLTTTQVVSDYIVQVPHGLAYDLELSYGTVKLENLAGVITAIINYADSINVTNHSGDAFFIISYSDGIVNGIDGELNLTSAYSDLEVMNISEDMTLHSRYSDVLISDLAKDLEILSAFDDLRLENIAGSVRGVSTYSEVNGLGLGTDQFWEYENGSVKLLHGDSN